MTSLQLGRRLVAALIVPALILIGCGKNEDPPADGESVLETPAVNNGPALLDPEGNAGADYPAPAPDFSLSTLAGSDFSLDEHRGEVILLNFWATWCGPCIIEIPDLQELHDTYEDSGLTVLGVSVEEGDEDLVREFVAEMGMTYPIAIDADVADDFGGVYGLPTTFVIDRQGQIVERIIGLFPTEQMMPRLQELLAESV